MKVINTRSPFHIVVNEIGQTGGRIELFIYHKDASIPILPTYSLSKLIPSLIQTELVWNISNYLNDEIDVISPILTNNTAPESNDIWLNCIVKRYKLVASAYVLLDQISYVGISGYTSFLDGMQQASDVPLKVLKNKAITNIYNGTNIGYVNLLIDKVADKNLFAIYERNDGIAYSIVQNLITGQSGIFNLKIPLSINNIDGNFVNGCKLTITYQTSGSPILNIFQTFPQEECRYTPVICAFVNSFGGWELLTFFKAQSNAFVVKNTDFNLMPKSYNYNILQGQKQSLNINGNSTIKINTGFIDENKNELIQNLLLSETILIDNKPVNIKTQSLTFKTNLKEKNINYEIEFEYSFNLINNVI